MHVVACGWFSLQDPALPQAVLDGSVPWGLALCPLYNGGAWQGYAPHTQPKSCRSVSGNAPPLLLFKLWLQPWVRMESALRPGLQAQDGGSGCWAQDGGVGSSAQDGGSGPLAQQVLGPGSSTELDAA